MEIRAFEPGDWPCLCEIHDLSRLDELRANGLVEAFLTLEQTADREGLFEGRLAVAVSDRRIQGFVAFSKNEVIWLYVHPVEYRRGVGRALLRYAIQQCGGDVSVEVLAWNQV